MSSNVLPIELRPIPKDGLHIFISFYINDRPVRMVLDTGASRTVLAQTAIERLKLNEGVTTTEDEAMGIGKDSFKTQLVKIPSMQIGNIHLKDWQFGVLDMEGINQTYTSLHLPQIDGILGNDLLVSLKAKIDYGRRQVRFWPR